MADAEDQAASTGRRRPRQLVRQGRGLLVLHPSLSESVKAFARAFALAFAAEVEVLETVKTSVTGAASEDETNDAITEQIVARIAPAKDLPPLAYIFSTRAADARLAERADCQFIPVNIDGENVRVEGLIDSKSIEKSKKPFRVCIFGPESTGKSTLAKKLAARFEAVLVPEYAREHLTYRGREMSYDDLDLIARGQCAATSALTENTSGLIIADSDLLTTFIYSHWFYGRCEEWIEAVANDPQEAFDLYLLTSIDVPWVDDHHRCVPEGREQFFERCQQELIARGYSYVLIEGNWEKRFNDSVAAIERAMSKIRF